MTNRILLVVLFTFVATLFISAHAQLVYKYPEDKPNFTISFPEGWKEKSKEDGYVSVASADDSIYMDFWALAGSGTSDDVNSTDDLTKDMGSWLKDIKIDRNKGGDFEVNGVSFICYSGTAKTKDGDQEQEIECDLCSVDGGKTVIAVVYYGDKDADKTHKDDLSYVFKSIKPI